MDRLAQQSIIANTEDLARWCAEQAEALDPLIDASYRRPLSVSETRHLLVTQRELLVRMSQQQTLIAAMVFERVADAPVVPGFWSRVKRLIR